MTTVAIDFGTSNTVVSILEADTKAPKTLRFDRISRLFKMRGDRETVREVPVVPTLVFVKGNDELVLGQQVRSQRLGASQPQRLFKTFKRDLAADFQPPPRQLDGVIYTAELISELFIQNVLQQLSSQSIEVDKIIFTVPVGAFERYLDWFRDVAKKLGVAEVQLIDESTAAALGYAATRPGEIVLAIDFGGGTLDLSLVRTGTAKGDTQTIQAEVLAKSDAYVGGEDVDSWIVEDYLRRIDSSREQVGEVGWQNLLELAEKLKIQLSSEEKATDSWLDEESFMSYELELTRERLEEILEGQQFLEQLRQALDEVLTVALEKGIAKSDIERVLLVGGSCLIPAVQQLIISYFGKSKVKFDKPFEAVACGALALGQIAGIDDYLRHSYAIRLWEPHSQTFSYFTLFDKGTKYPHERSQPLTLQAAIEGQQEIRLDIGEVADMAQAEVTFDRQGRMTSSQLRKQEQYRSLETHRQQVCVAHLNPPGQVGIDRIAVEFEVDEQRVLLATVRDLWTDKLLVERGAIAKLS